MVSSLARDNKDMIGIINVRDHRQKLKQKRDEKDPIKEYVKNFSDTAQIFQAKKADGTVSTGFNLAEQIKFKVKTE